MKKLLLTLSLGLLFNLSVFNNADAKTQNIKVGIIPQTNEKITFSSSGNGGFFVEQGDSIVKVADIEPRQFCTVNNKNGILEIFVDNKKIANLKSRVIIKSTDLKSKYVPLIFAGSKWYRGQVEVFPSLKNNKLTTVVNTLPLEEYLYGVVPSEMPASWPLEALKTQAVAARTYALKNISQYSKEGFDILPTTMSQVYEGAEAETPVSNQAVEETKGKVATYKSKLIEAYYSSGAGGLTESGLEAWGSDLPYLKSVKDFDFDSPKYNWYKHVTNEDIQGFIKKEYKTNIGKILSMNVTETTESGRAKKVKIKGLNGSVEVNPKKMRLALKLNSTLFQVTVAEPGTIEENNIPVPELFLFSGRGFGHGSGMSQFGARYLAKTGKTFDEILKHYYQGIEITDFK